MKKLFIAILLILSVPVSAATITCSVDKVVFIEAKDGVITTHYMNDSNVTFRLIQTNTGWVLEQKGLSTLIECEGAYFCAHTQGDGSFMIFNRSSTNEFFTHVVKSPESVISSMGGCSKS